MVDDDFMLIARWLLHDVPTDGDPIENLSRAFITYSSETSCKYVPNKNDKGKHLINSVRSNGAEGVIFASPSFCDPGAARPPDAAKRAKRPGYTVYGVQVRRKLGATTTHP